MADQARQQQYDIYDFVSTPIGVPLGASRGDVSEVTESLPSFYGEPDPKTDGGARANRDGDGAS